MKKSKLIPTLFLSFFKIGAFTFGGGYAMLSLLENEFVEKRGWITKEEFMDMVAIAESTPGPIGINMATYAGFKAISNEFNSGLWGILGGIIAPLSLVVPSVLAVLFVAKFFTNFKKRAS